MKKISLWAVAFLVLLRLTIGWQFLMEGLQKIRGNYLIGPTVTNKPFSSEGYFRGSTGPFASLIRSQLSDPDEELLAYTAVQSVPAGMNAADIKPAERMPVALGKVWDGYRDGFLASYTLDPTQLEQADVAVKQAKANYVEWLESEKDTDKKEVVRKVSGQEIPLKLTTKHRIEEYKRALEKVREFDKKRWVLFREVEKEDYAAARANAQEKRAALAKDVEEQTDKMRKALARIVRQKIDTSLALPGLDADLDKELPGLLTLAPTRDSDPLSAAVPATLDQRWKDYFEALCVNLKVENADQINTGKRVLDHARENLVVWLRDEEVQSRRAVALVGLVAGVEPVRGLQLTSTALAWANTPPGPPDLLLQYQTALRDPSGDIEAKKQLATLRTTLKTDLQKQTDAMKSDLDKMLTDTQKNVTVAPRAESWSFIKTLDLVVICVITAAGAMLLLGLFTRLGCILAAGFLLLTFLSAPPFPWLPLPPGTEGNPIYVNKNLIEFMALLALAGTASGRWAGVDGILAWMFGMEDPDAEATRPTEAPSESVATSPAVSVPVVPVKKQLK